MNLKRLSYSTVLVTRFGFPVKLEEKNDLGDYFRNIYIYIYSEEVISLDCLVISLRHLSS